MFFGEAAGVCMIAYPLAFVLQQVADILSEFQFGTMSTDADLVLFQQSIGSTFRLATGIPCAEPASC